MVEFALENQHQHQQLQQQPQHAGLHEILSHSSPLTGAISRTPARLPEDVTALADRDNVANREGATNKNAVTKTYHTLKDLISSKFKKENNEIMDELNNVVVHPQQPLATGTNGAVWSGEIGTTMLVRQTHHLVAQRALSQPHLNVQPTFERHYSQPLLDQIESRNGDIVTDSDDGGFATRSNTRIDTHRGELGRIGVNRGESGRIDWRESTRDGFQMHSSLQQNTLTGGLLMRSSPQQIFQCSSNIQNISGTAFGQQNQFVSPYQHQHQVLSGQQFNVNSQIQQQQQQQQQQQTQVKTEPEIGQMSGRQPSREISAKYGEMQPNLEKRREVLAKYGENQPNQQQQQPVSQPNAQSITAPTTKSSPIPMAQPRSIDIHRQNVDTKQGPPGSANSSDYDKSGNQSSNVDSGRGSAAYSSGRKAPQRDTESSDSPMRTGIKNDDSEWVDVVDAELRHILDPGMQGLTIRPESTVSGSVSSMSPPLPPLSPDNSSYKPAKSSSKDQKQQEYGTDSYNRPGRGAIGPSRAGWPGSSIHKQSSHARPGRKHEQALLKRHLFGLDNDQTSNTTRSLDLESLIGGGRWGTGQSVSDSETDTQGIRHIRMQLEGLEHMYGEVLRMLGTSRIPGRMHEQPTLRTAGFRRRHGSVSSLPSSSVSGRPIRDRKRTDDRRKVRDMKGINKRFQRLESHVVTLARSVAHLSSEMRSQHLVTQELERLRDDLTTLRAQARTQNMYRNNNVSATNQTTNEPEPPNLTNPKRVKKLTKFFGEDPPLMRLFLKRLGYEKYASLFEAERVGMVELPYLGEERLQKLGVPLGPRLRILQEAQISLCKDTTLCIV